MTPERQVHISPDLARTLSRIGYAFLGLLGMLAMAILFSKLSPAQVTTAKALGIWAETTDGVVVKARMGNAALHVDQDPKSHIWYLNLDELVPGNGLITVNVPGQPPRVDVDNSAIPYRVSAPNAPGPCTSPNGTGTLGTGAYASKGGFFYVCDPPTADDPGGWGRVKIDRNWTP